jgi:glutamate--cysteine ligase
MTLFIPVVPAAIAQDHVLSLPFAQQILAEQNKIEQWFEQNFKQVPAPYYASIDLRNAGFKLAPIDTNLFPAGFNNLHSEFDDWIVDAIKATLQINYPRLQRILLIPESHTRNLNYFENVASQIKLLTAAGFDVRCGSLRADLIAAEQVVLPSGQKIMLEPIKRTAEQQLIVSDFIPQLILLNNDLAEGIPEILLKLTQPLLPAMQLGWSLRKKSDHFHFYDQVIERFAELIAIDPWLMNAYFDTASDIDFLSHQGDEMLADKAAALFAKVQLKYDAYHISKKPFLIVKADAGTYGMGVIRITDPSELLHLNRKQRTKMSMSKGSQAIKQVILQEGVYSLERAGVPAVVAEPVIYTIGQFVVGGFYRSHAARADDEILNAPGMSFVPFQYAGDLAARFDQGVHSVPDPFYIYSVVARLALLAAAYEEAQA